MSIPMAPYWHESSCFILLSAEAQWGYIFLSSKVLSQHAISKPIKDQRAWAPYVIGMVKNMVEVIVRISTTKQTEFYVG